MQKNITLFMSILILAACSDGGDPKIGGYGGTVTNISENPNIEFISGALTGPDFKIETDNSGEIIERAASVWGANIYSGIGNDANMATEIASSESRQSHRGEPTASRTDQEKKLNIARGLFETAMNILANKNDYCVKNCENLTDSDIEKALLAFGLPSDLITRTQLLEYYNTESDYTHNDAIPDALKSAIINPNNSYTVRNVSAMNMFGFAPGNDSIVLKGKINVKNKTFDMVAYAKNGTRYPYTGDTSGFDSKNTEYVDGELVCNGVNGCEWPQIMKVSIPLANASDGYTQTDMNSTIFTTADGDTVYGPGVTTLALGNRNLSARLRYSDFGYLVSSAPNDSENGAISAHMATLSGGYDIKRVGAAEIGTGTTLSELADAARVDTNATYTGGAYAVLTDGIQPGTKQFDGTHATFAGTSKLTVDKSNPAASELNMNFGNSGWYNITVSNSGAITWDTSNLADNSAFIIKDTSAVTHMDGRIEFFGDNTTKSATEVVGTGTFQTAATSPAPNYNIETMDGHWRKIDVAFGAANYHTQAE